MSGYVLFRADFRGVSIGAPPDPAARWRFSWSQIGFDVAAQSIDSLDKTSPSVGQQCCFRCGTFALSPISTDSDPLNEELIGMLIAQELVKTMKGLLTDVKDMKVDILEEPFATIQWKMLLSRVWIVLLKANEVSFVNEPVIAAAGLGHRNALAIYLLDNQLQVLPIVESDLWVLCSATSKRSLRSMLLRFGLLSGNLCKSTQFYELLDNKAFVVLKEASRSAEQTVGRHRTQAEISSCGWYKSEQGTKNSDFKTTYSRGGASNSLQDGAAAVVIPAWIRTAVAEELFESDHCAKSTDGRAGNEDSNADQQESSFDDAGDLPLPILIHIVLKKLPIDIRLQCSRTIILSGAVTSIVNIADRLYSELEHSLHKKPKIEVIDDESFWQHAASVCRSDELRREYVVQRDTTIAIDEADWSTAIK